VAVAGTDWNFIENLLFSAAERTTAAVFLYITSELAFIMLKVYNKKKAITINIIQPNTSNDIKKTPPELL